MMALARVSDTLVLVPPGPLAAWSSALLMKASSLAQTPVRHIDRTDTLADGGTPAIFLCEFPSLSAISRVMEGTLDPVCVMADPQWVVAVQLARGASLLEALRLATASATANLATGRTSRSRLVYPELEHSAAAAAQRLLSACGLATDPTTLHGILSALDMSGDASLRTVLSQYSALANAPELEAAQSATTQSVMAGLIAMAEGLTSTPVVWPTAVFLSGDAPDTPAPEIASIVGPSRVVLYGPYLHLPPATYRGEITIAFSGRIDEIAFQLDFFSGQTPLTSLRMEGRKSGTYRGQFKLVIADPVPHIEIHLRNERGSIEGEVALQELRFYVDDPEVRAFS